MFNMAAPAGKVLKQTSAIFSRLKQACFFFYEYIYSQYGLQLLPVKNFCWRLVSVDFDYCSYKVSRRLPQEDNVAAPKNQ